MAAVVLAVAATAFLLLRDNGDGYYVRANFENASQIVPGNLVQVAGNKVGTVSDIHLTKNGEAELKLDITDKDYVPLRQGTKFVVRQASLSGIANRYIDLQMPPGKPDPIHSGDVVTQQDTTTAVDLDQIFDVFDPRTRKGLQDVIRGSAKQYAGSGELARRGWAYLNPAVATTSMLFRELNRDTGLFRRFIVQSGNLVGDLAERRDDLAGLVRNLATTTGAIASKRAALGGALRILPGFMRRANSTFVDLRATLDDLRPVVTASKPAAERLRPFLAVLKPFAAEARPTIHDLTNLVRRPGAHNDLYELTAETIPLAKITTGSVVRNGKLRDGSFPATVEALSKATPELNYARPWAPDLLGWFDDFSHTGVYDALGSIGRVAPNINAFSLNAGNLLPLDPALRAANAANLLTTGQYDKCPGASERGAAYKPSPDYPCDPTQQPPGK